MIVGTPREIKNHEYRVGLTPAGVHALAAAGHEVLLERNAGLRVGFPDAAYAEAGAKIVDNAAAVYGRADLVVKIKELQASECALARPGQILFCYHHLAPDPELARRMIEAGVSCLAYETVTDPHGGLPLLAPMSRVAGRLAPQMAAWSLQMANGGSGLLLGGVPGVLPARVVVIGAGTVGTSATRIAVGMGADVTLLGRGTAPLDEIDHIYRGRVKTCVSDPLALAELVAGADVVIGAVLVPGKRDAAAHSALPVAAHAARVGPGGCLDRPGRCRRDFAPDQPFRPDLCRGGRGALLRRQHARRLRPHFHPGAGPGHAALCRGAGEPRPARGRAARRRPEGRIADP